MTEMKRLVTGLICATFMLASCEHTFVDDFFVIHEQIDSLKFCNEESRQQIESISLTISTIYTIVDVLNGGYYVSSVESVMDGGRETGKRIRFTNGKQITVMHGADGADGHVPVIGIRKDNLTYYWTLDGEWLRDDTGRRIPVINESFNAPLIDLRNGYWYASFDKGDTWTRLGRAQGEDGFDGENGKEPLLRTDLSSEDGVTFVLNDGTALFVPFYVAVKINLETEDDGCIGIAGRESVRIRYSLSSVGEDTHVMASSDGFYTAVVEEESELDGIITVTCPKAYHDGFVNVTVYEKNGVSDVKVIRFYEKMLSFSKGRNFEAAPEGEVIRIPVESNFEHSFRIEEGCRDWISTVGTKAGMTGEELVVRIDRNNGIARSGMIFIDSTNGTGTFESIVISQASTLCRLDNADFVIESVGGTVLSNVETDFNLSVSVPYESGEWLKASVLHGYSGYNHTIAVTAQPNDFAQDRNSTVSILSEDGKTLLAQIKVLQKARNTDLEDDLIFIARPNYSNDFTAYLPIRRYTGNEGTLNCYIDWGDGTGEHLEGYEKPEENYPEGERCVYHHYEGLTTGRTFEVVVSGSVPVLYAEYIPEAFRSSITEIRQWGHTGLGRMEKAFKGFNGLETLPPDTKGAFSEVYSFYMAFADCPRLTTISDHLFDYASDANELAYAFQGDRSLAILPDRLFHKCKKARYCYGIFQNCSSLTQIPGGLFEGCSEIHSLSYVFAGCSSLREIPGELFGACYKVNDLSSCFSDCRNLSRIPQGLFDNNSEVTSLSLAFRDCDALTSIPEGLFDNNTKVSNFNFLFQFCDNIIYVPPSLFDKNRMAKSFLHVFEGCSSITSESPFSYVDGAKVHLYERKYYPDIFATPSEHDLCFSGAYRMSDYNSIPADWITEDLDNY